MKAKTKFLIMFVLVPMVFPIVSLYVGTHFKILPAMAVILLGTAVYAIMGLKYGNKIILEYIKEGAPTT